MIITKDYYIYSYSCFGFQEYLTDPVQVKVGKVSSPTANVIQILEKVSENEKVCYLCTVVYQKFGGLKVG